GAAGLLLGVLGLPGLQRFFAKKPFCFLGDICYSLYLLHFPVVATFSCWFFLGLHERLGYHLTVGLDFLCTTGLVLLAAWAGRRYLEPVSGVLERGIQRLFQRRKP